MHKLTLENEHYKLVGWCAKLEDELFCHRHIQFNSSSDYVENLKLITFVVFLSPLTDKLQVSTLSLLKAHQGRKTQEGATFCGLVNKWDADVQAEK